MTPTFVIDLDALARHVVRLGRDPKGLRPVGFRLDSEGIGRAVSLPGPDWLARMLTMPGAETYRDGPRLLARPKGSTADPQGLDVTDLADRLRAHLATLPERTDAGEAYGDVRLAAGTPSPRFSAYVLDVVRAYVKALPTVPAVDRPKAPVGPAMTAHDRVRAYRERKREEERASALWGLSLYVEDEETPKPGSRVAGADLFAYVEGRLAVAVERFEEIVVDPDPRDPEYGMNRAERLASWREVAADDWETAAPDRPRAVSRRVLYAIAEEQGHRITRPGNVVVLTIARIVARLKELTVNALDYAADVLGTGPANPEEYADEVVGRIVDRAPTDRPSDPALAAIAEALPFPVASAMASSEDPRRALGLVGRAWARQHPQTRASIVDAVRAFSPELVEAVLFRVATELRL